MIIANPISSDICPNAVYKDFRTNEVLKISRYDSRDNTAFDGHDWYTIDWRSYINISAYTLLSSVEILEFGLSETKNGILWFAKAKYSKTGDAEPLAILA